MVRKTSPTDEATATGPPTQPDPIEEIVRTTTKLRADHHRAATRLERSVGRMVDLLGRPTFVGLLVFIVLCWGAGNSLAPTLGYVPVDPPPFQWLELVVSCAALCITILILTTQRRDDQLAQQREEMTLDLAILAEQKLAKIIQLLEESRRDNPLLDNRVDPSADAMSSPADMQSLSAAARRKT
jgi:uncharacterized membrane protein